MIYGTHPRMKEQNREAYQTFRDLDLTVETARRTLETVKEQFDAIIVTGISGLVVGAPVALQLGLRLIVLRKEDETAHSLCKLIGAADLDETSRVLFLDDLIASGATFDRCKEALVPCEARITASYRYEYDDLRFEVQS